MDTLLGEAHHCLLGGHYARWFKENCAQSRGLYEPSASLSPVPDDLPEVWKCAVPADQHYNAWIAQRARAFLSNRSQDDDPFFLYVSFPDPHHPFSPPQPYCDRYDPEDVVLPSVVTGELDRMPNYLHAIDKDEWFDAAFGDYQAPPAGTMEQGMLIRTDNISEKTLRQAIAHTYGMVKMIDDCVGQVVSAVNDRGLAQDTIFLFTVDHGELLGDHGLLRKGAPPYDQLVRLPMVICGPGIPKNQDINTPTSHVDLFATLCDLCGVGGPTTEGKSLLPLLQGGASDWQRDTLFGEFYPRAHWDEVNHSIFTGDWRLTRYPQRPEWGELFNHAADPREHNNLFYDPGHAKIVADLTDRLLSEFPIASTDDAEVYGSY